MTKSKDGTPLYYESHGDADTALLFVHGWLGNLRWWDAQVKAFADRYRVVTLDLAGHGKSGRDRTEWSARTYADDIEAVAQEIPSRRLVLIGHSMSACYALEAYAGLADRVKAIVFVDTCHDLDQRITLEDSSPFFEALRRDFRGAVEHVLSQRLFVPASPRDVVARIKREFLQNEVNQAIRLLEPLYATDNRVAAAKVKVPVRAINSTELPTNAEANRQYLKDFDFLTMADTGHYPMLERPLLFNERLEKVLQSLSQK